MRLALKERKVGLPAALTCHVGLPTMKLAGARLADWHELRGVAPVCRQTESHRIPYRVAGSALVVLRTHGPSPQTSPVIYFQRAASIGRGPTPGKARPS